MATAAKGAEALQATVYKGKKFMAIAAKGAEALLATVVYGQPFLVIGASKIRDSPQAK